MPDMLTIKVTHRQTKLRREIATTSPVVAVEAFASLCLRNSEGVELREGVDVELWQHGLRVRGYSAPDPIYPMRFGLSDVADDARAMTQAPHGIRTNNAKAAAVFRALGYVVSEHAAGGDDGWTAGARVYYKIASSVQRHEDRLHVPEITQGF